MNRYLARPHRCPCCRPSGSAALPSAVLTASYTDVPYHIYLYFPYVYVPYVYVPYVYVPYVYFPYVCRPHRRPCRPHRSPPRGALTVYTVPDIFTLYGFPYIIETVSIINSYSELEAYSK